MVEVKRKGIKQKGVEWNNETIGYYYLCVSVLIEDNKWLMKIY